MSEIVIETQISAPIERCFDLARDIDSHLESTAPSRERAVGRVTSGVLGLGDEVTWEARHFGIRFRLTARITQFDPPASFTDEQLRGPFASWWHDHRFEVRDNRTNMTDEVRYSLRFGLLGRGVDRILVDRYLKRLLIRRCEFLKQAAERGR